MKKIVLVENRPWVWACGVAKLVQKGYAFKKDAEEEIWSYTNGFADIARALHDTFPERVLSATCLPGGQYSWDEK